MLFDVDTLARGRSAVALLLSDDYYIAHYGVKGMKWGVRRTREQLLHNRNSIQATLNRRLPSVKTPNGVKVKMIFSHALDQAVDPTRNVTANDIIQALTNPMKIDKIRVDESGRRSQRFYGQYSTVNVNPDNGVIATVWKTGTDKIKKYGG